MEKLSSAQSPAASVTDSGAASVSRQNMQRIAADHKLSRLLVEKGAISQKHYEKAVRLHAKAGGNIINNLLSLGYVQAAELVEILLAHPDEAGLDTSQMEISSTLIALLPVELARKHRTVPIDHNGNILLLGAADSLNTSAMTEISEATGLTPQVVLCAGEDIDMVLEVHYREEAAPREGGAPPSLSQRLWVSTKLSHVVHMIHRIGTLPALPETVTRVKEVMDDPNSSVHDVVSILTLDPPMAAKVLSVSNSAAYGFPNRIHDLTLAVSLLGLRETYGIVLSAAIANLADKVRHFNYQAFWIESMCSAAAARIVAKAAGLRRLPGIFSAGLLHDIGRIVLVELQPNSSQLIPRDLWGRALMEEEERVIGLSHTEAGYELARHWNLPDEIAETIRFHHTPERATVAREHVAIVALANVMACAPETSWEESDTIFNAHRTTLETLNLDKEMYEAMLDDFLKFRESALDDGLQSQA